MLSAGCRDYSDLSCFRPKRTYVENVADCIRASATSSEEARAAVSYLAGLCTAYITTNPVIAAVSSSIHKPRHSIDSHARSKTAKVGSNLATTPHHSVAATSDIADAIVHDAAASPKSLTPRRKHIAGFMTTVTVPVVELVIHTTVTTDFVHGNAWQTSGRPRPIEFAWHGAENTTGRAISTAVNYGNMSGASLRPKSGHWRSPFTTTASGAVSKRVNSAKLGITFVAAFWWL